VHFFYETKCLLNKGQLPFKETLSKHHTTTTPKPPHQRKELSPRLTRLAQHFTAACGKGQLQGEPHPIFEVAYQLHKGNSIRTWLSCTLGTVGRCHPVQKVLGSWRDLAVIGQSKGSESRHRCALELQHLLFWQYESTENTFQVW